MKRAVIKSLSWRIIATCVTGAVAYAVTGRWGWAGAIGGIDAGVKFVLYIVHEQAWER